MSPRINETLNVAPQPNASVLDVLLLGEGERVEGYFAASLNRRSIDLYDVGANMFQRPEGVAILCV
jgi:hypothetical protein